MPTTMRRLALAAAALIAALPCLAATGMATASPAQLMPSAAQETQDVAGDDFYLPPSPLPAGDPGDIIRSRPSEVGWPSARAKAWQVMYLSTDALGEPTAMTGTVLVPEGVDPGSAPIVAFGPGTQGAGFQCAPSRMISSGAFYEQSGLNDLLHNGFAVAVPDYEGYWPEPETTYVTGRSMGAAMIDVVRASQRLADAGLSADAKVAFRGYSQGGGAAAWAGELRPDYAPELNLVGIAAGGIPADPVQLALHLDGKQGFGVMAYALIGFDNAYPELDLGSYLNDAGVRAFAEMETVCTLRLLVDYAGKSIQDYTHTSPLLRPEWVARYEDNTLGANPPAVPMLQYHATQDELVQFGQAKALRDTYCEAEVPLTWQTLDMGHIDAVYHGNAAVLSFLDARLAGEPAGTTC
ncbi:lipase family protein [Haloechinothrix salitolerans]